MYMHLHFFNWLLHVICILEHLTFIKITLACLIPENYVFSLHDNQLAYHVIDYFELREISRLSR